MTQFAEQLKTLRRQYHYTMQTLADKAGVSKSMISKIESGDVQPTLEMASRLAVSLETSLAEMLSSKERIPTILQKEGEQSIWQDPKSGSKRRLLTPSTEDSQLEWLYVDAPEGGQVECQALAPGYEKFMHVLKGSLAIKLVDNTYELSKGDSLYFKADKPHVIENKSPRLSEYYVVISKPKRIGLS